MSNIFSLLGRRAAMFSDAGGKLPYDAEIEYLGGDGTAYIDTSLKGGLNTKIYVKFYTPSTESYNCICGSRSQNTNAITLISHISSTTQRFGSQSASLLFSSATMYEVTMDKTGVSVNDVVTSWSQTSSFTTSTNVQVFFAGSTSLAKYKGRIYAFKMWDGKTLQRDMIPVRVGTTGYMYDKVSGELFGNVGSGAFVIGNDI